MADHIFNGIFTCYVFYHLQKTEKNIASWLVAWLYMEYAPHDGVDTMKVLVICEKDRDCLHEMAINGRSPRERRRAQVILSLADGKTLKAAVAEFKVHENSVRNWRKRWVCLGLKGLFEGKHLGRQFKWSDAQRRAFGELAAAEGGSVASLLVKVQLSRQQPSICEQTAMRYLKKMRCSYKRYRLSLRGKHDPEEFENGRKVIKALSDMSENAEADLRLFDEAGFSPNPPIQSGWGFVGVQRCAIPMSHEQRVNVLGAVDCNGEMIWSAQMHTSTREDVINFLDKLADTPHTLPITILFDNASTHKGVPMEERRSQWASKNLYFDYLPAYSPELNRAEVVWKQGKYFRRNFVSLKGEALLAEVRSVMQSFGPEFEVNPRPPPTSPHKSPTKPPTPVATVDSATLPVESGCCFSIFAHAKHFPVEIKVLHSTFLSVECSARMKPTQQ